MSPLVNWEIDSTGHQCPHCDRTDLDYRIVEDGEGHEDIQYWCPDCKQMHWVEGCDS